MRLQDHDVDVPKNWGDDLIYKEDQKELKTVDLMQKQFPSKKKKKKRKMLRDWDPNGAISKLPRFNLTFEFSRLNLGMNEEFPNKNTKSRFKNLNEVLLEVLFEIRSTSKRERSC